MNRDQLEELAALRALGLLEGDELRAFERELEINPAARQLVAELSTAAAGLALAADQAAPPASLRDRVLAALPDRQADGTKRVRPSQPQTSRRKRDTVASFSWMPWALAACLAVAAGLLFINNRGLRDQVATLETQRESARQELAAIIVESQGLRDHVARLEQNRVLDRLQIATLQTQRGADPNTSAVAAWDPETQQGLLKFVNLPPLAENRDYQLWVIDPRYPDPVNSGIFETTQTGDGRIVFQPTQEISEVTAFAISDAPEGGEAKPTGTIVLMGK